MNDKKVALITFTPSLFAFGMRSIEAKIRELGYTVTTIYAGTEKDNQTSELHQTQLEILCNLTKECDVIGISAISIHNLKRVTQVCNYLRSNSNSDIIIGGVAATLTPNIYAELCDAVCVGEGEGFIEAYLVGKGKRLTPNCVFKSENGTFIETEKGSLVDVDQLPIPKFDLENTYLLNGNNLTSLSESPNIINSQCKTKGYRIMRARGCPYRCTYCCNNALNRLNKGLGKPVRVRSIERFIEELEYAKRTIPDLASIYLLDDDLMAEPREQFYSFVDEYKKRIDLPIWELSCTFKSFSEDKLNSILNNDIHIDHIRFGIQSANKRVNKEVFYRFFDKHDFIKKITVVGKSNIPMYLDIIVNNPYETYSDLKENIKFFRDLGNSLAKENIDPKKIYLNPFSLKFYPGTQLYEMAIKDHIIDENYIEEDLLTTHYAKLEYKDIQTALIFVYYSMILGRMKFISRVVELTFVLKIADFILKNSVTSKIIPTLKKIYTNLRK